MTEKALDRGILLVVYAQISSKMNRITYHTILT